MACGVGKPLFLGWGQVDELASEAVRNGKYYKAPEFGQRVPGLGLRAAKVSA